ncbi:MAG: Asp-tRNA(Asn)/Glu-tRNA(Gln) amidotransferase subunit GatC [Peptococcaceae bacterium]|nr:Asp-tRNA(Asn)/Glu-tRNA(Gln) amidotransferase subunit GatC [Peptococcaceae bacterium]
MISKDVVEKVAKLSRLHLEEEEIAQYADQLNQILDTMAGLQQIDTDGVAPLAHVLPIENVFREDEVGECFTQETVLANAPEQSNGMFQVPKIV